MFKRLLKFFGNKNARGLIYLILDSLKDGSITTREIIKITHAILECFGVKVIDDYELNEGKFVDELTLKIRVPKYKDDK